MPDNHAVVVDILFNGETRRLSVSLTTRETVCHQVIDTWDWSLGTVHFGPDGKVYEVHDLVSGSTRCRSSVSIEVLLYLILEDWIRLKYQKPILTDVGRASE